MYGGGEPPLGVGESARAPGKQGRVDVYGVASAAALDIWAGDVEGGSETPAVTWG